MNKFKIDDEVNTKDGKGIILHVGIRYVTLCMKTGIFKSHIIDYNKLEIFLGE